MQFIVEYINPLNNWIFSHLAVIKFLMKCINSAYALDLVIAASVPSENATEGGGSTINENL